MWDAVGVLPARGLDVEKGPQGVPLLQAGRVLPVRLERLPEVVVQSLVVRVAVLHHDGGDAVRVPRREPVADRRAVILHVERVLRQAEYRGELLDHGGEVVEGVSELVPRRHRAVAEARVVGGEHAVAVGQGRDQVAEHLRARREAVQQKHCRRVLRPGLAVEDVQVTDLDRPVGHFLLDHGASRVRVGGQFLGVSNPSIDKGPAPPRISASRPAIYRRLTSYPGGPNCGPSAVNPMVLMALKPYRRWTVNIATSIMTISGILTAATNAPARIARPPRISRSVDAQAVASGSGAPTCSSSPANPAGSRLSLAHP